MNTSDKPLQHLLGLAAKPPTSPEITPFVPRPQTSPVVSPLLSPNKIVMPPRIPDRPTPQIPTFKFPPRQQALPIIPGQSTPIIIPPVKSPIIPPVKSPIIVPVKSPAIPQNIPRQWFNLKGQAFEESPRQWYNLRTSRLVANKPGTYEPVYGLKGIRILGTREDVENFWRINIQRINEVFPRVTTINNILFEPFEDIAYLSEDVAERSQMCFVNTAGTVIAATNTRDIASLTQNQIDSMCRFTFGGLFVKGKIISTVDGDTFDMAFYVPIALLGQGRAFNEKKLQAPVIPTIGYEQTGFFAKVSIRMYGYDAAEKDTNAGKLAKTLMEDKFRSLGGIVWCQFVEATIADDKYGRTLAVLYEDEQKTRLLNNYLLEQEKIYNIKMVFPYIGGTKKTF